jgi:DNA-3-methyladenine glycosylase II
MKHLEAARKHLSKVDRQLAKTIRKVKLEKRKRKRVSPYERLASAIISQQISTKAAEAIWKKFSSLFENGRIDFLKLDQISEVSLRSAGVSPQKIGYLKDLARRVVNESLPKNSILARQTDEKIIETLLPIKGVGVWTIQMLLIFHYERPDVWPVRDLGVKKGFMKVHNKKQLPEEADLEKFGEKFKPFRSYAALYYWRALDN